MFTNALKTYSLSALQKALNHAISLDEGAINNLATLEGKTLKIIILPLQVHFFIQFENKTILLRSHCAKLADTTIHSSPLGLIRLSFLPSSSVRSLFNDKVRISGDVQVGQQIKQLFDELDIDWEGHLAHFTGDVVAHQVGNFVRKGMRFTRRINHSIATNLTTYIQDECYATPSKQELEDFYAEIDELSLTVERLAARLQLLTQSTSKM